MDAIRKSATYAEGQIRLLLSDLKNTNHTIRVKAVKRFQDYITSYRPQVYDDDVDVLFCGAATEGDAVPMGLLHFCGLDSGKHAGQLKRIAATAISLLSFLLTLQTTEDDAENIFYERFLQLPVNDLVKVNFYRHIGVATGKNKSKDLRSGGGETALEILALLCNEHRTPDGEPDPIPPGSLLVGDVDGKCEEKYNTWTNKSKSRTVNNDRVAPLARPRPTARSVRPVTWSQVTFKPVPLQEGEEGEAEVFELVSEVPPYPDPLGIAMEIDLRAAQQLFAAGRLSHRQSIGESDIDVMKNKRISIVEDIENEDEDEGEEGSDDDNDTGSIVDSDEPVLPEDEEIGEFEEENYSVKKRKTQSILPVDKSFSPSLFLSLIHCNMTFEDLKDGLSHLKGQLKSQSFQRENLVRSHFGLFVHCAEGLEWLKAYRRGAHTLMDFDVMNSQGRKRKTAAELELSVMLRAGSKTNIIGFTQPLQEKEKDKDKDKKKIVVVESGGERLKRAHTLLLKAQSETKNILTPILVRMEKAKKIKTADQALLSIVALLSYPHSMRKALGKEEYEEVLIISRRILGMSPGNVLSSAKVLCQVQNTANSIINELKQKCLDALLGVEKVKNGIENGENGVNENRENGGDDNYESRDDNSSVNNGVDINVDDGDDNVTHTIPNLYRFVNLLYEIDGEELQKKYLKMCFYKKLTKFGKKIQNYRKLYFEDANQALKLGKKYAFEKKNEMKNARKELKNANGESEKGFYGNKGISGISDSNGNDVNKKNVAKGFSIYENRGFNENIVESSGADWYPTRVTKREKIMLKNILNEKKEVRKGTGKGRGRGKGKEREMGRSVKEKKIHDDEGVGGDREGRDTLQDDFGLIESDEDEGGDDDSDNDDYDDDTDSADNNNNNNNSRYSNDNKNVKSYRSEKDVKSKVTFQDTNSQKVKKFQLFASVDDEEIHHKSSNKNYAEDQKSNVVGKLGRGSITNKKGKSTGSSSGLYVRAEISENYYCGLFIARVRLLYIIRVVRSMEIWTPVLTHLTQMMAPKGSDNLGPKTPTPIVRQPSRNDQNNYGNQNNDKNQSNNVNKSNNNSLYYLQQTQCSKLLGAILNICTLNIRESFFGTNFSVTGVGLNSLKKSEIVPLNIEMTVKKSDMNNVIKNNRKSINLSKRKNSFNIENYSDSKNGNVLDKYMSSSNIFENLYDTNSNIFGNTTVRVTGIQNENSGDFHSILVLFSPDIPRQNSYDKRENNNRNSRISTQYDSDDDVNYEIFLESYFTEPLSDPCLSVAIKDICRLYSNLELMFLLSPVITPHIPFDGNLSLSTTVFQNNDIKKSKSYHATNSPIPQGKKNLTPATHTATPTVITSKEPKLAVQGAFTEALVHLKQLAKEGDIHICSVLLEDQIENPSNANKTNNRHYANKAKKDNLKKPAFASSGISCYFPLEIEEQTKDFEYVFLHVLLKAFKGTERPEWIAWTVIDSIPPLLAAYLIALQESPTLPPSVSLLLNPGGMGEGSNPGSGTASPKGLKGMEGRGLVRTDSTDSMSSTSSAEVSVKQWSKGRDRRTGREKSLLFNSDMMGEKEKERREREKENLMSIDLSTLENELKLAVDKGLQKASSFQNDKKERKNTENVHDETSVHLLDMLRATVALRTVILPKIWRVTLKHFPPPPLDKKNAQDNVVLINEFADDPTFKRLTGYGSDIFASMTLNGEYNSNNESSEGIGPSVMPVMLSSMNSVIILECSAVRAYVRHKTEIIRLALSSGYSVLVKKEKGGYWEDEKNKEKDHARTAQSLPVHLSRALLIIGYEKNNLKRTLNQVKVEHGYVGKSVNTEFDENQKKANLDIGVLVTVEKSNSASNSGQKKYFDESVEKKENYEQLLFTKLCVCLLVVYDEIVAELSDPSTGSTKENDEKPFSLLQAVEEREFIKVVFKEILPNSPHTQEISPTELKKYKKSANKLYSPFILTCSQLLALHEGRMLRALIQQK